MHIKTATDNISQSNSNSFDKALFILTCMRYAYQKQFNELEQDPGEFIGNIESQNPSSSEPKYDEFLQYLLDEYGFKNKDSDAMQEEEIKRDEAMDRLRKDLQFSSITLNTSSNSNSLTLVEQQEKFWKHFAPLLNKEIKANKKQKFSGYSEVTPRTGNYLGLNHKTSAKAIELNLNRKSTRVIIGVVNRKNGGSQLKKEFRQFLDDTIENLKNKNTDDSTEIGIIDNTNHTGYYIKNNSLGLDLSSYDELSEWYIAQIYEGLETLKSL